MKAHFFLIETKNYAMKKYFWEISTKNSSVRFKVKYLQISNITGSFLKFHGRVEAEENFQNPSIKLIINAESIQTYNKASDRKIKSSLLLSTNNYPLIEFVSDSGCSQSIGKIWELTGELSVKNISKPVTMVINYSQIRYNAPSPTATFHLFGKISRSEFNIDYENGKDLSDDIFLTSEIHLIRKTH